MKRIIVTALIVIASLVVVDKAPAQRLAVKVVIPFSFNAAGTQLPAGNYTIRTEGGFTYMVRDDGRRWWLVNTSPLVDKRPQGRKLIFSVYGGQYFLQKILYPGSNMSLEFSPSKAEIKARQQTENASGFDQDALLLKQ
jgi:hypothetical protein